MVKIKLKNTCNSVKLYSQMLMILIIIVAIGMICFLLERGRVWVGEFSGNVVFRGEVAAWEDDAILKQ